jgi:heterodisulfide reductase subunit C
MTTDNHNHTENHGLISEISKNTGVGIIKCYQCGKCSAGCPMVTEMDYSPSLSMRMLQTNSSVNDERLIRSYTIWLCVTCEMCISRCPMEIDIPKVMDYLREKSLNQRKANPKAKNIIAFHKSFLNSIRRTGRLYEVGLLMDYKARTMMLMQDLSLAPVMFLKGKLNIIPEMIRNRRVISSIFKKTQRKKKEVSL